MKNYVCPKCRMEYDSSGKCEMCGVDLVKKDSVKNDMSYKEKHYSLESIRAHYSPSQSPIIFGFLGNN